MNAFFLVFIVVMEMFSEVLAVFFGGIGKIFSFMWELISEIFIWIAEEIEDLFSPKEDR